MRRSRFFVSSSFFHQIQAWSRGSSRATMHVVSRFWRWSITHTFSESIHRKMARCQCAQQMIHYVLFVGHQILIQLPKSMEYLMNALFKMLPAVVIKLFFVFRSLVMIESNVTPTYMHISRCKKITSLGGSSSTPWELSGDHFSSHQRDRWSKEGLI